MDKVRRSLIGFGDDNDPPVISRVVFATIAHIGCGNVTGTRQPFAKESMLIRRE